MGTRSSETWGQSGACLDRLWGGGLMLVLACRLDLEAGACLKSQGLHGRVGCGRLCRYLERLLLVFGRPRLPLGAWWTHSNSPFWGWAMQERGDAAIYRWEAALAFTAVTLSLLPLWKGPASLPSLPRGQPRLCFTTGEPSPAI